MEKDMEILVWILTIFIFILIAGMKHNEWIDRWRDVETDHFPKDNQHVLIHGKGGRRVVAQFTKGKFLAQDYWHEDFEECEYVTHWKPLSKLPERPE